ncbi:MAG: hypothetical protein GX303_08200 [Clostridiales bacterium]|nr:hypothetical protein [Clostridiales bacterium]
MKYKDSDKIEIERCCAFCERSASLRDPNNVLCSSRGIVSVNYICRKFSYDPLKRRPRRLSHIFIPSENELKL